MGASCSKESIPERVLFNPNDPIDEVHTIPKACAPTGAAMEYMLPLLPSNGEYGWAGEGDDCHYCSDEPPRETTCSSCDGGCCPIWGKRGTYKRVSYDADPVQCCILGTKTIKDKTCDPKYADPHSESCFLATKEYCSKNPFRLWSDSKCQTWCANNAAECKLQKGSFCNDPNNIKNKECLDWCVADPGKCDIAMRQYCSENPLDYRCGCINSPLLQHQHNPLCDDRKCIDFGYATASQITSRGKGCQIIDCKTYFDIKSKGEVHFDDVTIQDRCDTPGSTKTPQMIESLETEENLVDMVRERKTLIFFIFLVIVFLFLIFIEKR